MKALSLTQPWASLVESGAKRIETRGWPTRYRGPVAIHAAKGFPSWAKNLCYTAPFCDVLRKHGMLRPEQLPLGLVLCITSIQDCRRTEDLTREISELERAFGDYGPGRYGFVLGPVTRVFDPPIPARGALGFWDWSECPANSGDLAVAVQTSLFSKEPSC